MDVLAVLRETRISTLVTVIRPGGWGRGRGTRAAGIGEQTRNRNGGLNGSARATFARLSGGLSRSAVSGSGFGSTFIGGDTGKSVPPIGNIVAARRGVSLANAAIAEPKARPLRGKIRAILAVGSRAARLTATTSGIKKHRCTGVVYYSADLERQITSGQPIHSWESAVVIYAGGR